MKYELRIFMEGEDCIEEKATRQCKTETRERSKKGREGGECGSEGSSKGSKEE